MLCSWPESFSFSMLYVLLAVLALAAAAPADHAPKQKILSKYSRVDEPLRCPLGSDLYPCKCLHTGHDTAVIRCSGLSPSIDVQPIFRLVSQFQISTLTIADSSLDHLSAQLFLPLEINFLHLRSVTCTRFAIFNDISQTYPMPRLLDSLLSIEIDQAVGIDKWDWSGFRSFRALDEVIIRDSSFPRLTKSFGSLPNTVTTISFENILDMKSIAYGALSRLQNLTSLRITNTSLDSFERHAIAKPAPKLLVLDLSNNRLTSLAHDLFTDMPALRSVFLRGNRISTIISSIFNPVAPNLGSRFTLSLKDNPFNCDCHLAWLNKMYAKNPGVFGNRPDMVCSEPKPLRGELVHALVPSDFECSKNYNLLLSSGQFDLDVGTVESESEERSPIPTNLLESAQGS